MIIIDVHKAKGIWTKGASGRFLTSMISPGLQKEIKGLSIGMVIVPPGTKGGRHSHQEAQEFWYVIEGKGRIQIGEEEGDIRPGHLIYGPAKTDHQIINDSEDEYLKALLILCPAGDEAPILKELKNNCGIIFKENRARQKQPI